MNIRLQNDFHGTTVLVRVHDRRLTANQVRRIRARLCGVSGCTCAQHETGVRGPQAATLEPCAPDGMCRVNF
jgi:hypothetical protein